MTPLERVLDDDPLFQAVKAALIRRSPRPSSDRSSSPPVEVSLRMLVVKHLDGVLWPPHGVSAHLVVRQFGRVSVEPGTDDTPLLR